MGTVDFLRANHGTSTIGSLRKGPGLILDGSIIIFPLKVAIKIQSASVRHGQISYRSLYDIYDSAQFRARADEVRGESLQFKRGELIKFRKRGGQKLLSKHVQRVKKNFSGSRKFFLFPSE